MSMMRIAGWAGSLAIAVCLSACVAARPPDAARHAPAAPVANVPRPAEHIYVTADSLDSACYDEVGEVAYVEPFAQAAIDPNHLAMDDGLREAAAEKYPNQVDAIINVHTSDRDVGTEVAVSGEAVRLAPPGKIDCKLPEKLAAVFAGFATGARTRGQMRGAGGTAFNGPAGATNSAQEIEGNEEHWRIREKITRSILATMPGQTQVDERSLADQAELQQARIKDLRRRIDRLVRRRCAAADASASECDSMRNAAELRQPHETVVTADQGANASAPTPFELQNLIQEQRETIEKLQRRLADLSASADPADGAAPPH